MATCQFDRDCPADEACYAGVTWLAPGEDECQCSTYYGWTRNLQTGECTTWTQTAYFWVTMSSIIVVCVMFLSILLLPCWEGKRRRKLTKFRLLEAFFSF
jgi:hypothetical protein